MLFPGNMVILITLPLILVSSVCIADADISTNQSGVEIVYPCKAYKDAAYCISIFGGVVPIAGSYVLVPAGSSHVIELNKAIGEDVGYIRAGSLSEYREVYEPSYEGRDFTEISRYGLKIIKFSPPSNETQLGDISTVVIQNSTEFLLVLDKDPYMWESLLVYLNRIE